MYVERRKFFTLDGREHYRTMEHIVSLMYLEVLLSVHGELKSEKW